MLQWQLRRPCLQVPRRPLTAQAWPLPDRAHGYTRTKAATVGACRSFAQRNDRTPAFPQEPVRGSNAWIKWVALALLVAAIAGGVMMASNMKGLTGAGNSASSSSQAGKDGISPEDKAKADALVGPLGGSTAAQTTPAENATIAGAVDNAPATAVAPVATTPDTVSDAPAPAASPELSSAPASGKPPVPAPARTPAVKKNTAPSLDDLLD
jgi:hypothetical protein